MSPTHQAKAEAQILRSACDIRVARCARGGHLGCAAESHRPCYLGVDVDAVLAHAARCRELLRLQASRAVIAPWITARVFGAAGVTGFGRNGLPDDAWLRRSTDGLKSSAGAGVSLGWDLLHFDVGRGLTDGADWEFLFLIQRRFWEWL